MPVNGPDSRFKKKGADPIPIRQDQKPNFHILESESGKLDIRSDSV